VALQQTGTGLQQQWVLLAKGRHVQSTPVKLQLDLDHDTGQYHLFSGQSTLLVCDQRNIGLGVRHADERKAFTHLVSVQETLITLVQCARFNLSGSMQAASMLQQKDFKFV
jgi:hypothetical protein